METAETLHFEWGDDTGLDSYTTRKLQSVLLDGEVAVPPSGRTNSENFGYWNRDSLISYGKWLCSILELQPGETGALKEEHIDKASKLGLGPSRIVIHDRMDGGMSELQRELGFENSGQFRRITKDENIEKGRELADLLGRRPKRPDIEAAFSEGKHPSYRQTLHRFDNMSNYYELIGRPISSLWEKEDFLDWSMAFKRQNPDTRLTPAIVHYFLSKGVGPSPQAIKRRFPDGLPEFAQATEETFETTMAQEDAARQERLKSAQELIDGDEALASVCCSLEESRKLQKVGMYKLIVRFAPGTGTEQMKRLLTQRGPVSLSQWLLSKTKAKSEADIEVAAVEEEVIDDLWPMYRFQNVDLKVPEYLQ